MASGPLESCSGRNILILQEKTTCHLRFQVGLMNKPGSRLCLDCVEDILDKYAVEISRGWWNRFKEEHYRFVDQNIKDNAKKEPWSCH
ncbi:hypothetical protein CK498_20965 [Halomonas salipaludis]|uniref:Uncharacterized protein n=2 Tax=Halomonas salipaludis TaxID=2032625 RepID=A0A2A2ERP2_9GAMM|nr:hypothetical protein CK498_20965 [Halomonas salipaludis]